MTRKRERSVRSEAENSHGAEPAGTCAAPLSDLPPTTPAPTVHDERNVKLLRPALPGACDVSDSRPDERESLQPEAHLRVTTASSTSELQVVPDGATTENSSHDKPGSSKPSKTHGRERQSPRMVEAIIRSLPGRVVTVTCLLPGRRRVFF